MIAELLFIFPFYLHSCHLAVLIMWSNNLAFFHMK